jgi:AAA domain
LYPAQRQSFEIIAGYYILSYIYPLMLLETNDNDDDIIAEEKIKLEYLVGREKIGSNQLITFLHCPGGSGKSTIIALVQLYSKEYHALLQHDSYNRSIVVTAMTGVAATNIGGETAHSALCLATRTTTNITYDKIELWTNTKLLIIDEISFATNFLIKQMNEILKLL